MGLVAVLRKRSRWKSSVRALTALMMAGLGIALWGSAAPIGTAWAESKAKERLAGDLTLLTFQQVQASKLVPERDQKRVAKCLAQAIVADITEEDAARLSDIFEGRVKTDPALQKKWFTISKQDAPDRNKQVMQQVQKLCPDVGPYAKQIL